MLKRSLKGYLFVIPASIAFLLMATNVWLPQPVIVPLPDLGFVDCTESSVPAVLLILFSFLLYDGYEIELGLVCGVRTTRLAMIKAIPAFLYTVITTWVIILCHRYEPFDPGQYRIRIPMYVPENYKVYLLLSAFVTLLFFAALFFFIRVLTRNCFLPVGVGLFVWLALYSISMDVRAGEVNVVKILLDPFISTYFIGNTIPNEMAAKYNDLTGLANAWTYNRLLFLGLAIVLLVATWLLLRREKLHESIGD